MTHFQATHPPHQIPNAPLNFFAFLSPTQTKIFSVPGFENPEYFHFYTTQTQFNNLAHIYFLLHVNHVNAITGGSVAFK